MQKKYYFLLILAAILGLGGCAAITPSHVLNAKVAASHDVNPNLYGRPSPVVVVFYQLKNVDAFNGADFDTLYQNPQQALGGDFVSQKQVEVAPGKATVIDWKLDPTTKYLGVVAAYSQLNNTVWRQYVQFQSTWAEESLVINVNRSKISIDYLL
jgi:type VI secretion system protein VasD